MEEDLKITIANNLRVMRAKKRFSQEQLAEMAGISAKYLTRIENEKVNPSVLILLKLANALEITINDIVYH